MTNKEMAPEARRHKIAIPNLTDQTPIIQPVPTASEVGADLNRTAVLMGHHNRNRCVAKQIAGHTAGRHFPQARLIISACYNDIRSDLLCLVQQDRADRSRRAALRPSR